MSTVKALLTDIALRRLTPGVFHFCPTSRCDVVYFSDAGQRFVTRDVRVRVWQKQPEGGRTICYCFGENEADMQREIDDHGRTLAVDRVRQHVAHRRCACEVRNPRGTCCLADLVRVGRELDARRALAK